MLLAVWYFVCSLFFVTFLSFGCMTLLHYTTVHYSLSEKFCVDDDDIQALITV